MKQASRYLPVYLGLAASLILAIACNAFLDIRYGGFGFEVLLWACLVVWACGQSWKCRFDPPASTSSKFQQWFASIGLLLFVVVFMPIWGLPRAGAYLLVMLALAGIAAPLTPQRLHMGAVAAVALAMFAVAHHRADWTMLFYLIPFAAALVFTLVAQQLSRRAEQVRSSSLGHQAAGKLAPAALSATLLILLLGGLLYAITPQPTWLDLSSPWGQQRLPKSPTDNAPEQDGQGGAQDSGTSGSGTAGTNGKRDSRFEWPGAKAMREAAQRPGMPDWQSGALLQLADLSDALAPLKAGLDQAMGNMQQWLKETWLQFKIPILLLLLLLLVALLLWGLRKYWQELQPVLWCRTRLDWAHCLWFPPVGAQRRICGLYAAATRLLALEGEARQHQWSPREYQNFIHWNRPDLADELAVLTRAFEQARYGPADTELETWQQQALRAYRVLFGKC